MSIDLDELAREIREMNSRREMYKVLRRELSLLGYWKNKPRGDPKKGYSISKFRKDGN